MSIHNATDLSTTQQQASGASIVWALTAIGTNAMLQPSFTSYLHGYSFEGGIWPHRSSPCFCLIDAVAEVWMIARTIRQTIRQTHEPNLATAATVLTRVAIFVLGVLPQAIQLFSMRGIPGTQAVATILLFATVLSMARSIRAEVPLDGIIQFKAEIERLTSLRIETIQLFTSCIGGGIHVMLLIYLWHRMLPDLQIVVSDEVYNATQWVRAILVTLALVYTMQHTVFKLSGGPSRVPKLPILFIVQAFMPEALLVRKQTYRLKDRKVLTYHAIATTIALSSLMAYVAQLVVMWLLRWQKRDEPQVDEASVLPVCVRSDSTIQTLTAADVGQLPRGTSADGPGTLPTATTLENLAETVASASPLTSANQSDSQITLDGRDHAKPDHILSTSTQAQSIDSSTDESRSLFRRLFDTTIRLAFYPLTILIMTLHYMGLFNPRAESFFDFDSDAQSDESTTRRQPIRLQMRTRGVRAFQFVERWILMLILRLPLEFHRLIVESWDHYTQKINSLSEDIAMNAFAIFNLATMMLYYFVAFDGRGTSSPAWSDNLG